MQLGFLGEHLYFYKCDIMTQQPLSHFCIMTDHLQFLRPRSSPGGVNTEEHLYFISEPMKDSVHFSFSRIFLRISNRKVQICCGAAANRATHTPVHISEVSGGRLRDKGSANVTLNEREMVNTKLHFEECCVCHDGTPPSKARTTTGEGS